jgi:hypothetical protein
MRSKIDTQRFARRWQIPAGRCRRVRCVDGPRCRKLATASKQLSVVRLSTARALEQMPNRPKNYPIIGAKSVPDSQNKHRTEAHWENGRSLRTPDFRRYKCR